MYTTRYLFYTINHNIVGCIQQGTGEVYTINQYIVGCIQQGTGEVYTINQ